MVFLIRYMLVIFGWTTVFFYYCEKTSCGLVENLTDSDTGSLRDMIQCIPSGDTIYFNLNIVTDTIILESEILINKDVTIYNTANNPIYISTHSEHPLFNIEAQNTLNLIGLSLLGGTMELGSCIHNNGILRLDDTNLNSNGYGNISATILNLSNAEIHIINECSILKDSLEGLIFETNFDLNESYCVGNLGLWNGGSNNVTAPLEGWDGVFATGNSMITLMEGEGVNNSNALKLTWDATASQPTVSLGKHLTHVNSTGYDELYIRYHVKLPNNFKAAQLGGSINHWKWGRLWQNTTIDTLPNGLINGNWTENRVDSKYVVWNFDGNVPYTDTNVLWGANEGQNLNLGSAGGERIGIDYFVTGSIPENSLGYFESIWDINSTDRPHELENNQTQTYHTIEYHFKLATDSSSQDGVFEMWWDGVWQGDYTRIAGIAGAPTPAGIPTTRDVSGFNFLVLFDNMSGWNSDWSNPDFEGYILINDVVVSENRIGHNYVAGNKY